MPKIILRVQFDKFTGRTTTPKQVSHELSKFWKMVYGEKTIDKAAMQDLLEGLPNEDGVREGGLRAKAILRPSRLKPRSKTRRWRE